MGTPVQRGEAMVREMAPRLCDGVFVFAATDDPVPRGALGMFREAEGVSAILPAASGAPGGMRQITLDVYSALDGVGLTAAVSASLAEADIACNMVAALHHDHVFVPEADAARALSILTDLSASRDT